MGNLVRNYTLKNMILCSGTRSHIQAGDITPNINVKVDFTLPEISAINVVTWKFHVDVSSKDRYGMILV